MAGGPHPRRPARRRGRHAAAGARRRADPPLPRAGRGRRARRRPPRHARPPAADGPRARRPPGRRRPSRSTPGPTGPSWRQQLTALAGVGPWTAAYVALRGLGDPDVFLASDLGVRRALEQLGAARRSPARRGAGGLVAAVALVRAAPPLGEPVVTAARDTYVTATVDSPVGPLTVLASAAGLRAILWPNDVGRGRPGRRRRPAWPSAAHAPTIRSRPSRHRGHADAAGRVLRGHPPRVRAAPRPPRDALPGQGLAGAGHHPVRDDDDLRRPGPAARRRPLGAGRRRRQRPEPGQHRAPLPPRRRLDRRAHRLRRRPRGQAGAARPRASRWRPAADRSPSLACSS